MSGGSIPRIFEGSAVSIKVFTWKSQSHIDVNNRALGSWNTHLNPGTRVDDLLACD